MSVKRMRLLIDFAERLLWRHIVIFGKQSEEELCVVWVKKMMMKWDVLRNFLKPEHIVNENPLKQLTSEEITKLIKHVFFCPWGVVSYNGDIRTMKSTKP